MIFVIFSFSPSIYEISQKHLIPVSRTFTLEHNYLFDYNFYLSRIREGQEGNWLVTEKYYNQRHNPSLFQIFYLYLGKLGGLLGAQPPEIYHTVRLILGFCLLYLAGRYILTLLSPIWSFTGYLFLVTLGSWPILVKAGENWRFATYMGWWSVADSLQRITTIPHVLFGQIMLLIFIWKFSHKLPSLPKLLLLIGLGNIAGVVFPPTLIIVYIYFAILSILEGINLFNLGNKGGPLIINKTRSKLWLKELILPRIIFGFLTFPSLIYMQLSFRELPWSALPLFDIQHRIPLPFIEYILALGPVFWLGLSGLTVALLRKQKKFYPVIAWVIALFTLFKIFEYVPQQSPLRFTEGLINVPLGILDAYLFESIFEVTGKLKKTPKMFFRSTSVGVIIITVLLGIGVMISMVGWLTDQVRWRREGTWKVAIGAQLAYPLNDFMNGLEFLKHNTKINDVVLGYITSGNFIPAYAGNYVYLGHANTPDEDAKEKIAAGFFSGKMKGDEAQDFLKKEHISYIFFGPQERELGGNAGLKVIYPFISKAYENKEVIIYKYD